MKVVKVIMKVVPFPLIAVMWLVDIRANLLLSLGSYVLGQLMFYTLIWYLYGSEAAL